MESGSNDPMAYTLTFIFLSLLKQENINVGLVLIRQVFVGALLGFTIAFIISNLINKIDFNQDGLVNIFIFAMAFFTFSISDHLGGNGYLSVYILGIYIGNKTFMAKKEIVFFFDGISELMNIGLFFFLGLLADPIKVVQNLPIAFVIMLFMTLIARPLSVKILLGPFKLSNNQISMISWAGLRGAAAIVFAIFAINSKIVFSIDIYHIVFGICLLSSLIQGSLMPKISSLLNMLDKKNQIVRNFNYFQGKGNITFIKSLVDEDSPYIGKRLKDIYVSKGFIVAKVIRNNKVLVPKGDLLVEENDILVLSGEEYFDPYGQELHEFSISENHSWIGKMLSELKLPESELIVSIDRDGRQIPPIGKTIIKKGDRILLFTIK